MIIMKEEKWLESSYWIFLLTSLKYFWLKSLKWCSMDICFTLLHYLVMNFAFRCPCCFTNFVRIEAHFFKVISENLTSNDHCLNLQQGADTTIEGTCKIMFIRLQIMFVRLQIMLWFIWLWLSLLLTAKDDKDDEPNNRVCEAAEKEKLAKVTRPQGRYKLLRFRHLYLPWKYICN